MDNTEGLQPIVSGHSGCRSSGDDLFEMVQLLHQRVGAIGVECIDGEFLPLGGSSAVGA